MGKREKKQKHQRNHHRGVFNYCQDEEDDNSIYQLTQPYSSPSSPPRVSVPDEEKELEGGAGGGHDDDNSGEKEVVNDETSSNDIPSKFLLYQQSVQSPKGDISYMQKFFLTYVGGRMPLHLQEDFCGTALLSAEWLRSDPRRTVVGLDLDLEALQWCIENNMPKVGPDGFSRISLFHGNVLQPLQSKLIISSPQELTRNITLADDRKILETGILEAKSQAGSAGQDEFIKRNVSLPARDIVCAFNYSCCCLHKRADLVSYFRQAHSVLSTKGGIFVMDLYGGASSEHKLRLQRRFPNFTVFCSCYKFVTLTALDRIG